jgi:heterodisulfide reductase subunit C
MTALAPGIAPIQPVAGEPVAASLANFRIQACLQCRKCSGGCPIATGADMLPHEVIRMLQLGQSKAVLASRFIWDCTSCHTCSTRCPQQVDLAGVNDALRCHSAAQKEQESARAVIAFHEALLNCVRRLGRVHEISVMTAFKLRTRRFMADVGKFPLMLAKGKLPLWPRSVPGRAARKAMFRRIAQTGGPRDSGTTGGTRP